jgi:hypothetical protein
VGATTVEPVQVWDVGAQSLAFSLRGHTAPVTSITFSPDSRRIVTSSGLPANFPLRAGTGETIFWDARTGQELLHLDNGTSNLTFTADGRQLYGYDESITGRAEVHRWHAAPLSPEREAGLLADALTLAPSGQRLPLKSELLAQVDADASLDETARERARQRIRGFRRPPGDLIAAAGQLARTPNQISADYRRAMHYMEELLDSEPDNREAWTMRALAHYRLDQPAEALAALAKSRELYAAEKLSLPADDLTILAMTQHRSGQPDEARATIERVRTAASRNQAELQKLLAEAESLLAIPDGIATPTPGPSP